MQPPAEPTPAEASGALQHLAAAELPDNDEDWGHAKADQVFEDPAPESPQALALTIVGQDGAELRCCGRRCLYGDRRTGAQCSRVCLKPPGHAGYHDCLRPQGPGHDAATDNEALALTADAPQPSPPLMQLRAKPCPIVPRRPTPPPGPPPPRMVIQAALARLIQVRRPPSKGDGKQR